MYWIIIIYKKYTWRINIKFHAGIAVDMYIPNIYILDAYETRGWCGISWAVRATRPMRFARGWLDLPKVFSVTLPFKMDVMAGQSLFVIFILYHYYSYHGPTIKIPNFYSTGLDPIECD